MVKSSKSGIRGKQQSLVIVVEGAGQARDLSTECRRAFRKLIEGFGVNRSPSIVCGADRGKAFDTFKNFRKQGVDVLLLIDSEANIDSSSTPWQYLHDSGVNWKWLGSEQEKDADCQFMVACMENWFIACSNSLSIGPKNHKINASDAQIAKPESVSKAEVFRLLNDVYKRAGQREYSKGQHSFDLLEHVDPTVIHTTCPWANRFLEEVKARCK